MDLADCLGPTFVDALAQISDAFVGENYAFALVGATALLLHDVDLPRTTRDLDVAVAVAGGLEAIRSVLAAADLAETSIPHRYTTRNRVEVDILAIDPTTDSPSEIRLTDGDRVEAITLPEAIEHSMRFPVGKSEVPVAPLCLLIAGKLHAGRTETRPHDLDDACAGMEAYEQGGTRRFSVNYADLPSLVFETAGAFLAGRDTAGLLSTETKAALDASIASLLDDRRLSDRFASGPKRRNLVSAYRLGLTMGAGT